MLAAHTFVGMAFDFEAIGMAAARVVDPASPCPTCEYQTIKSDWQSGITGESTCPKHYHQTHSPLV